MFSALRFLLSISIAATYASVAWAASGPSDLAARIEIHSIDTLTLTDQAFLKGDTSGKPVTISGELRLPQGNGPFPTVILMHGSGGMGAGIDLWAREFNRMGVATFALDGFTGRGLTQVNTNQALLGRLNFILDIYRSLDILAKHPRIDSKRIALMGFSRGGQAALYASVTRFQTMWNKSNIELAAYVAFYPDCATTYVDDSHVAARPIRIFGGTPDDYNPIALCKAYAQKLQHAGADVQTTEYPHAFHVFDSPLSPFPAVTVPAQTVRNCKITEEPQGMLINAVTRQPFTYDDPCVEHGVHIGYDPDAAQQAVRSVASFVKDLFALK